jgi:limonene-1,2-epoxide hydrolase
MTRITISKDCGNSPKNKLIQQFTVAFARREVKFILDSVTDTIRWNIVGIRSIEGKEELAEFIKGSKNNRVASLTIHHIASHGKAGAVDGTQKLKNGEMLAFCNVFEFGNTKGSTICEITSYVIPVK